MKSITLHCPDCNKKGIITLEENIISGSDRSITSINMAEDIVCEHSLIVYIDNNFDVRDCFVCDFKIELPQASMILEF